MLNPVYTLTGAVKNPLLAIDIILSNYFKALKSSSTIVPNQICSFIHDIQRAKTNASIKDNIVSSINQLLSGYFADYNTTVVLEENNGKYDLSIKVQASDNGVNIDVGKLVTTTSTRIERIVEISNKGAR